MKLKVCLLTITLWSFHALSGSARADFVLEFTYSGLTASQEALFVSAKNTWENIITGYVTTVNPLDFADDLDGQLEIAASAVAIDGVGGTFGQAGPLTGISGEGYTFAATGEMEFDTADLAALEASGSLLDVILHEIAHVIGFGTLWDQGLNNLYDSATFQYTGAAALAQYQTEFGQAGATFIPIEQGGGPGTAGGHWDEVDGGAAPTGITDAFGNDMQNELMTGWLNAPTFISDMTIASFQDLGYQVNFAANDAQNVPEPGSLLLLGSCAAGFFVIRRQKQRLGNTRKEG